MGYRGTRAQLEARLIALPAELAEMHGRLAEASERVEALRQEQWGWLGVLWLRLNLRAALRDVDVRGPVDRRTVAGLRAAVERYERALVRGRDVLHWLEQPLRAPDDAPAVVAEPEDPNEVEQLRGRLDALHAELGQIHNEIAGAAARVESRRNAEWGWLGVRAFRASLRRALGDTAVTDHEAGSGADLRDAVRRTEEALGRGREVLGWLDEQLVPGRPFKPWKRAPMSASGSIGVFAVIGSVTRTLGRLVFPVLVLVGVVLSIAALAAGDGDADDFDLDVDSDGWESRSPPMAAEERHAADVAIGKGVSVFFVALCAAGAGVWWWIR